MKKFVLVAIIISLTVLLSSVSSAVKKSAGPPSCYAGEPPTNANCTSCHTGNALNSGTADITLDLGGADTLYTPGKTYTFNISVSKSGMKAGGFQFIALQDNNLNKSPGIITLTDKNRTQVIDKNNPHGGACAIGDKTWTEHTYDGIFSDANGKSSWSFDWKAPDANAGPITFYLACVESNNDMTDEGDYVYTTTKKSTSVVTSLQKTPKEAGISVYPIPAQSNLYINSDKKPLGIEVVSMSGSSVKTFSESGIDYVNGTTMISVDGLPAGQYVLRLKYQGFYVCEDFTILH